MIAALIIIIVFCAVIVWAFLRFLIKLEKRKMKTIAKIILYITLNISLILVILWSLMIYTSLMSEKLPWYEPCGMQFLVILIISLPLFITIGVLEILLGKFMPISKTMKLLPFITGVGMALLVLVCGSLRFWMQITGTLIGLVSILVTIIYTIKDLTKIKLEDIS